MTDDVEEAREIAEKRYEIDYRGALYNAVYSGLSSLAAGSIMTVAGIVAAEGLVAAMVIIFVAQILPKFAKELDKKRSKETARERGYTAALLENDLVTDDSNKRKGVVGFLGRSSAF